MPLWAVLFFGCAQTAGVTTLLAVLGAAALAGFALLGPALGPRPRHRPSA